jgi:hypothetical protein
MPSTMNRLLLPLALALAFLAPVLASPSSARALENRVGGQKLASHVGVSAQSDVASESRWGKTRSRMDFTSGYLLAPGGGQPLYRGVKPNPKHPEQFRLANEGIARPRGGPRGSCKTQCW